MKLFIVTFFRHCTHLLDMLRSSFPGSFLLSFTFSSVTYFSFYPELQLFEIQLNSEFLNSLILLSFTCFFNHIGYYLERRLLTHLRSKNSASFHQAPTMCILDTIIHQKWVAYIFLNVKKRKEEKVGCFKPPLRKVWTLEQ